MKTAFLFTSLLLFAADVKAQSDTTIRHQSLEGVTFHEKAGRLETKKINVNRKSLKHKLSHGLQFQGLNVMTGPTLTDEFRLSESEVSRRAVISSVRCKLDKYDTTIFSVYLVLYKDGPDSSTAYYCLNGATWRDGWAFYQFEDRETPELATDESFHLGYAFSLKDRRYPFVSYAIYETPVVVRQFLPREDRFMEKLADARKVLPGGHPVHGYPFVLKYGYSDQQ